MKEFLNWVIMKYYCVFKFVVFEIIIEFREKKRWMIVDVIMCDRV